MMNSMVIFALITVLSACSGADGKSMPTATIPLEPHVTSVATPATLPEVELSKAKIDVTEFESKKVHSNIQKVNKNQSLVAKTSMNNFDVFAATPNDYLELLPSSPVDLNLASVAVHHQPVRVVSHISVSISMSDTSITEAGIMSTLLSADEPKDIIFAKSKNFIAATSNEQQYMHTIREDVRSARNPNLYKTDRTPTNIWQFDNNEQDIAFAERKEVEENINGNQPDNLLDIETKIYRRDIAIEPRLSLNQLPALVHHKRTFTCTHPNKGCQSTLDKSLNNTLIF